MVRRLVLIACVTILALCSVPADAAGSARNYEGTTAQLDGNGDPYPIGFQLVKRNDGTFRLKGMSLGGTLTCEDASQVFMFAFFLFIPGRALDGRILTYDEVDLDLAVHVHGRFRAQQADGTLELTIPALTADEQAQLCTTGEVAWTALRTQPPILNMAVPNGETRSISLYGGKTRVDIVFLRPSA